MASAGRLDWREWETADKQKHQLVSVVANSVQFLDPPVSQHGEDEDDDTLDEDEE